MYRHTGERLRVKVVKCIDWCDVQYVARHYGLVISTNTQRNKSCHRSCRSLVKFYLLM